MRRWAIAAALFACACSSSSASGGGHDAGSDGAALADGAAGDDAASGEPGACGAAPYVTLGISVTVAFGSDQGKPVPGVRFTAPTCPGVEATSDAAGKIVGRMSKGAVFYGRFEADGYTSILTPEAKYDADDDTIAIGMYPSLFTTIIRGYDGTLGTIFIGATQADTADAGTDACSALDGISFAVDGHPELTPTYYSTASIPAPTTGTSTTTAGRASFTGVPVGEPLTITATKPGCTVTFVHGANTGRAPSEAGFVTLIGAYVGK